MSGKPERFIDENNLRLDGRQLDEIRSMKIKIGVLKRADGSCYLEWGNNKIIVGVFGPREMHPKRAQKADSATIRYRYNMAPFSTEDRIRPGLNRRSTEISKVSGEAFEPVVFTHLYPGTVIDIFAEVLQADAGTRTAAINAASLALADAGIPMKGLISSCAVGKVDNKLILDLNKIEDMHGDADVAVSMTEDGLITLLQMDGNLSQDEFKEAIALAELGCKKILEIQKGALLDKYQIEPYINSNPDELDDIAKEKKISEEFECKTDGFYA